MNATGRLKDFSCLNSSQVDIFIKFKILRIGGFQNWVESKNLDITSLFISCQFLDRDTPFGLPVRTCSSPNEKNGSWDEWIQLPIKYRDLTEKSRLEFTLTTTYEPKVATNIMTTNFSFFLENGILDTGKQRLLWRCLEEDIISKTNDKDNQDLKNLTRIENLRKIYERGDIKKCEWLDPLSMKKMDELAEKVNKKTRKPFLYILIPHFNFPVVLNEMEYDLQNLIPEWLPKNMSITYDNDALNEHNPAELMYRKLTRAYPFGPEAKFSRGGKDVRDKMDVKNLKPSTECREKLLAILRYPPSQPLSEEDARLLWIYRYYLKHDKKALTKFLKIVSWNDPSEVEEAIELLELWANIDVEDALELLGPSFEDKNVRAYAVNQLRRAGEEDLQLYLLQLVQALKFEKIEKTESGLLKSTLIEFLFEKGLKNVLLGSYLQWYLVVECEDKRYGPLFEKVTLQYMQNMTQLPTGQRTKDVVKRQDELVCKLTDLSRIVQEHKGTRPQKVQYLREYIADPKHGLLTFSPLPLPLDPRVIVKGVNPAKTDIFKSTMLPLLLVFVKEDGGEYSLIFKMGDDLRQDQLVIQIITLMDNLLRKENLDLNLTPYKVLATHTNQGMVQFIPSFPLATCLSRYNGNIQQYLRECNPQPASEESYGVDPRALDRYIKSCAGYCVITYILGVGDRHLDNLLITKEGCLFHVDFGFILGRDPKPFPPPMKLSKEMVDAMGGPGSKYYLQFKSYCHLAFNKLRKSANLLLNLLSLMVDANIPDIAIEPDKAVMKVQERFQLQMEEEDAIQYFEALIEESVRSFLPQVIETFHKWAQNMRS